MSTDADWDKWGESDPYFGVLSSGEYHAENLNEESRAKFFQSGDEYINRTLIDVRNHLDVNYQPQRCVDFGCGVGRLVIPLAGLSETVVGIDVSDYMLAEASTNCRKRNLDNVSFVKSDDNLTELTGSYDLIHSCLVLQHIPSSRGMRLLNALLQHLEPGGVVAIQFYYRCDAPRIVRALVKLRYKLPFANAARNLMRGRPLSEPAMQLHTYDLEAIIGLLKGSGVDSIYMRPFRHDDFQSVALYGQKAKSAGEN